MAQLWTLYYHGANSTEGQFLISQKILIIEDDPDIVDVLTYNLSRDGYEVLAASDGSAGLRMVQADPPDLVLLDLMLPGRPGLEICRELKSRAETSSVAVVIITAKSEEVDIVAGLELGADDYITKPFSPRVVLARLRAVLRRAHEPQADNSAVLRRHNLVIDPGRHEVQVDHQIITLTITEFRLLHFLAGRPGWVFTRDQIVDRIRGEEVMVTDRTVDVHVAGLRKKLGSAGSYIETVRGIGYRFCQEPDGD
ncbi:MAG: response regulator transcription factor [bacterium]